jgi:hypothetical protein
MSTKNAEARNAWSFFSVSEARPEKVKLHDGEHSECVCFSLFKKSIFVVKFTKNT